MKFNSTKSVAIMVCLLLFLVHGCTNSSQKAEVQPAPSAVPGAASTPDTSPEITASVKNESVPAYQTVFRGGTEWRQGRYQTGVRGGQLRAVLVSGDPKSFNPWVSEDAFSQELCNLMFRGLADVDLSNSEVIPDMAAEIKIEPDKVTYTTRLRKGLKWSDGEAITAEDVAFTWNKLIAQGFASAPLRESLLVDGKLPTCESLDELTNKFVTARPCSSFLRKLAVLKIAPKHKLEAMADSRDRSSFKQLWAAGSDTSGMVTDGPFRVSDYVSGQKVEFTRAEGFYMIDANGNQLPYLDKITYLLVPDAGSVVLEFGRKNADIAHFRPRDEKWISSQQNEGGYKLYDLGVSTGLSFLVFNMNQRIDSKLNRPFVDPVKAAWFNNSDFRQAINHAVNRQGIVNSFFKGAGKASFVCMPPESPYFDAELRAFPSNSKYSSELLSRAGFNKNKDGKLCDKDGNKIEFSLQYLAKSNYYEAAAQQIVDDLKPLGIELSKLAVDPDELRELMDGRKKWEAQLFSVSCDPVEPESSSNLFCSNGSLHLFDQRESDSTGEIVVSDARPWEQRIDEIFQQADQEFDKQKRKQLFAEFQKIVYDEAPYIYIASPDVLIGARRSVQNFSPTPLSQASIGLHNVEEIYIDTYKAAPVAAITGGATSK